MEWDVPPHAAWKDSEEMTWSPPPIPNHRARSPCSVSAPRVQGVSRPPLPGEGSSPPSAPRGVGRRGPCWGGAGSPVRANVSLVLQHLLTARATQHLRVPPHRAQASCPLAVLRAPCHQTLAPASQPPRAPTRPQGHVRALAAWPAPPATPPRARPGQQVRLSRPTCVPSTCPALP